jgi:hypothetical protein
MTQVTESSTPYHNKPRQTEKFATKCKVRHCFECLGDTEFYCNTCKQDLCVKCKEKHVLDLHTKIHDVVTYREKFNRFSTGEYCVRHSNEKYIMFCVQCNICVCNQCTDHRTHSLVVLRAAYQAKRQQHRETINTIRSETLYNCRVLLAGIQTDIRTCPPQIRHH